MKTLDVYSLGDEGAEQFLDKYSRLYGEGQTHGYERIIRKTSVKIDGKNSFESEHFFDKSKFDEFEVK